MGPVCASASALEHNMSAATTTTGANRMGALLSCGKDTAFSGSAHWKDALLFAPCQHLEHRSLIELDRVVVDVEVDVTSGHVRIHLLRQRCHIFAAGIRMGK